MEFVGYLLLIGFGILTMLMALKYKILRVLVALPMAILAAQAAALILFGE
ncbi:hypothetical protein EI165_08680 [Pseudoalteromonas nigrifaciens]|nr:hypothetical protein [Pseudoalteromonas nigrifaciens]MBE0420198.1 hypothetical protein [Pseudoalteromonas nigrifaciens]